MSNETHPAVSEDELGTAITAVHADTGILLHRDTLRAIATSMSNRLKTTRVDFSKAFRGALKDNLPRSIQANSARGKAYAKALGIIFSKRRAERTKRTRAQVQPAPQPRMLYTD